MSAKGCDLLGYCQYGTSKFLNMTPSAILNAWQAYKVYFKQQDTKSGRRVERALQRISFHRTELLTPVLALQDYVAASWGHEKAVMQISMDDV